MGFLLHLSPLRNLNLDLGLKVSLLGVLQKVLPCFWELSRRENTWIEKKKNWDWFRKPNNAWVLFSWLKLDWLIDWLVGQKFDIGQWFIMNAGFALALEIPGNIFDCYNWGYYRHLVDRGQGYCQKPYSVQDGPLTTKNYIRHPPSPKLRTAWKKEIDLARDGKADKGKV